MNKIVVRKSDKKILSFGSEDMSRFSPQEFDVVETILENLPDELDYCFYREGKVVVDEALKQKTLDAEAQAEKEAQEAREHIKLETFAGLTNTQIDNWVSNNVTDLAGGRKAIKILAKLVRASIRSQMLRQDD